MMLFTENSKGFTKNGGTMPCPMACEIRDASILKSLHLL